MAEVIQPSSTVAGLVGIAAPTPIRMGQSFTTVSAGTIASVASHLQTESTSPSDNFYLKLYTVDGSGFPQTSVLQEGSVAGSTISPTGGYSVFKFAFAASVAAATKYAYVWSRDTPSGVNYAVVDGGNADQYADGTLMRDNAGVWQNLTQDANIVITVDTPVAVGGRDSRNLAILGVG